MGGATSQAAGALGLGSGSGAASGGGPGGPLGADVGGGGAGSAGGPSGNISSPSTGSNPSNLSGTGGGDPSMAIAQMLLQIGGQALLNQRADERDRKNVREYKNKLEDIDLRSEATYRGNRSMLQNAIGKYYAKKGWELPKDTMPGYGTTRALPGEEELYPEYDVPKAEWYYGKKDKEAPEEQESTQGQEEVVTAPAPYTGSVSSPIMGSAQQPPTPGYDGFENQPLAIGQDEQSQIRAMRGIEAIANNGTQTDNQLRQMLSKGPIKYY